MSNPASRLFSESVEINATVRTRGKKNELFLDIQIMNKIFLGLKFN